MQYVVADLALVAGAHHHGVGATLGSAAGGDQALDPQRVLPDSLQARILRVHCAARVIDRPRQTHVLAVRVEDFDDLERVHMDMEGMTD